ncbi:NUDIX domain-containing protein [Streptomyces sp. NPDC102282]|uniref:NUDIX domain-containing protein n=1 Tax=Streptomyces sp. NPDC102282 TaxID=3366154 RepID=UPI0038084838
MYIRVTGIIIESGKILLLNQDTDGPRKWSLPGGKVDAGETLEEALIRELQEETGADFEVGRLLYLCDNTGAHVVHITFAARLVGGKVGAVEDSADTRPIRGVKFVALDELPALGFGDLFVKLCKSGFPNAGSYMGPKSAIGL